VSEVLGAEGRLGIGGRVSLPFRRVSLVTCRRVSPVTVGVCRLSNV